MKAVAPALQPAAGDFLSAADKRQVGAHRLDIGRVDEVDPHIGGSVEDLARDTFIGLLAEGRGTEANARSSHASAAEPGRDPFGVPHGVT